MMTEWTDLDEKGDLRPIGPECLIAAIVELAALRAQISPAVSRREAVNLSLRINAVLLGR